MGIDGFLTVCEITRFPWSYISLFKDKLKDNGSWQSVYQGERKKRDTGPGSEFLYD